MGDPASILDPPWREAYSPGNVVPCPLQAVDGDTLQSHEDGMQGGVVPQHLTGLGWEEKELSVGEQEP